LTNGFDHVEDVVGRWLIAGVVKNEPITESKLGRILGSVPRSITPSLRAMSVKVNEVIGLAGFVVPGTRVDVLVTVREKDESHSRVAVSNVQVLTAGTRYDQESAQRDGKLIPTTVVTLLVTSEDAESIALAQTEGQLTLALRSPMDLEPTDTPGARTKTIFGEAPKPQAAPKPAVKRPVAVEPVAVPAAPGRNYYGVEPWRGDPILENPPPRMGCTKVVPSEWPSCLEYERRPRTF
jgi:pilus assembly protein CpaB